ncbi:MAG: SPFH domain-containing protein, partial [Chloroflexia bacterium]
GTQGAEDRLNAREQFQQQVKKKAEDRLRKTGVNLLDLNVEQIVVPPEVQQFLSMPLKRDLDIFWVKAHEEAIKRVAEGLQTAVNTIRQATTEAPAEVRPHLLLGLTSLLERISRDVLQLMAPYRESPEAPEGKGEERLYLPTRKGGPEPPTS